jgi:hypothetical protein
MEYSTVTHNDYFLIFFFAIIDDSIGGGIAADVPPWMVM